MKARSSRRSLVIAAGACAAGAAIGGPAIAFVLAPVTSGSPTDARWMPTVPLDRLKEGEAQRVALVGARRDAWTVERKVEVGSVWLLRRGDEVVAWSAVCPHLGCSVAALDDGFACPCHTSAFDASGRRTSGPSPRDLDVLATKLENGVVVVDFRQFRIGIAEKIELRT